MAVFPIVRAIPFLGAVLALIAAIGVRDVMIRSLQGLDEECEIGDGVVTLD